MPTDPLSPPDPWERYHSERCDHEYDAHDPCSCGLAELLAAERQQADAQVGAWVQKHNDMVTRCAHEMDARIRAEAEVASLTQQLDGLQKNRNYLLDLVVTTQILLDTQSSDAPTAKEAITDRVNKLTAQVTAQDARLQAKREAAEQQITALRPTEEQLHRWLSAMETDASYEQRRDAWNSLREFFTVAAPLSGDPA